MVYNVSSHPHIRDDVSTSSLMLDVIVALLPTTLFGISVFGINALIIILICILTSVISELLFNIITKRKNSLTDLSAILTGLLIALNMPANINIFIPIIACVFAIVIVKNLFGGLGQNFMNPALAGRCFVSISFASSMNNFIYDGVTTATPLSAVRNGLNADIFNMIIGYIPGCIGEVSKIALLIGAIYLLIRRVISFRIPLFYILSFTFMIIIFGDRASDINYIVAEVFGGGLILGAFFMATDYVTSPINSLGQILYGVFLGVLNGIFRLYGSSTEGCSFTIIIGNLLVPYFDKITMPKAFGR